MKIMGKAAWRRPTIVLQESRRGFLCCRSALLLRGAQSHLSGPAFFDCQIRIRAQVAFASGGSKFHLALAFAQIAPLDSRMPVMAMVTAHPFFIMRIQLVLGGNRQA